MGGGVNFLILIKGGVEEKIKVIHENLITNSIQI